MFNVTLSPVTVMAKLANECATVLATAEDENTTFAFEENFGNLTNQTTPLDAAKAVENIKLISYISLPILFVVGLVGNTLAFIIMLSEYFRRSTTSVYLSSLAVSDSIFIIVSPFAKPFVTGLIGYDIKSVSPASCKAFFWVFRTAKVCSICTVMIICVERFLVIWFPLKAKTISVKRSAIITMLSMFLLVGTFNGVWTITSDLLNGACQPNLVTPETKSLTAAFFVGSTSVFFLIPLVVLWILTPLTIFKLLKQQSIRRKLHVSGGMRDIQSMQITRTLLSVMIAFILLVTPMSIAHSISFANDNNIFHSTKPNVVYFREVAQMLESLNFSINFFLYVVSNATFRKKLFSLCVCSPQTSGSLPQPSDKAIEINPGCSKESLERTIEEGISVE